MRNLLFMSFVLMLSFSLTVNAQNKDKKTASVKKEVTATVPAKADKKAEGKEGKVFNKVCPVSGEDLEDNDITYTYNGKTYGLCCNKCLAKFKKDPAKYAARLNEDGTKYKKQ